jgi:plasmid stability protein
MTYTDKSIIIRNVPDQVRRELRAAAAMEGRPMQRVVLDLILQYLKQKEYEGRG